MLEKRQDMTEIFTLDPELRGDFCRQIKAIPDLHRLIKKFQRKTITATLKVEL